MPVYVITVHSCDCRPNQDFVYKTDSMIAAAIEFQDKIEELNRQVAAAGIDPHEEFRVVEIVESDLKFADSEWMIAEVEELKELTAEK